MGLLDAPTRPTLARQATMVVLGDSLIEQGGMITANVHIAPNSPWPWANILLNHRFKIVANAGVGGQTTSQILARLQSDCISLKPGWVHLLAGTNNMGAVGGLAQAKADITTMLDRLGTAGIRVAIGTIPPRITGNYTGTIKADTFALNAWIIDQARTRPGVVCVDYFSALADGSGNYSSTLYGWNPTTDGTHLSATGGYACGRALAAALGTHTSGQHYWALNNPGPNLLSDPRFLNGGSGSAPSSWPLGGNATGTVTWSKTARTDGVPGSWQTVAVPTGSTTLTFQNNATVDGTRLAAGDQVVGLVEFELSNLDQAATTGFQGFMAHLKGYTGSAFTGTVSTMSNYNAPNAARKGTLRTPVYTVPASGISIVALFIEIAGGGTYSVDRCGLYRVADFPSL